jgi:hypothetical protein
VWGEGVLLELCVLSGGLESRVFIHLQECLGWMGSGLLVAVISSHCIMFCSQRDVATRDNIDYVNTVLEFAKKKLYELMKLIIQSTGE